MISSAFEALIFDMDGLMINTEPMYWEIARKLANRYGKTVTDTTLRKMMGRSVHDSMRIYVEESGIPITPQEIMVIRTEMMTQRFSAGGRPDAGTDRPAQRLPAANSNLAVATSAALEHAAIILPQLKIHDYFDVIVTGNQVQNGKPNPEIYLKALSQLNVAPAKGIVLEDSKAGAQAGKNAGSYVIAVPNELTAPEDFSFANVRVNNLIEARKHLNQLLGA